MLTVKLLDGVKIKFSEVNHQVMALPTSKHEKTGFDIPERIMLKLSIGDVRVTTFDPADGVFTQIEDVQQHILMGYATEEEWVLSKKVAFEAERKRQEEASPEFQKAEKKRLAKVAKAAKAKVLKGSVKKKK